MMTIVEESAANTIEVGDPAGRPIQFNFLYINIHLLYLAITTNLDELQGASKIIGRFYS